MNNEQTKKMECPFTWEIDKTLSDEFDEMEELIVDANEEPLYAFINMIAKAYFVTGNNNEDALEKLAFIDEYWEMLDESLLDSFGVSARVLLHVKEATKYFVYKESGHKQEAEQVLKNLVDAANFQNSFELATISGCKSVAWSSFHEKSHKRVTEFARLASTGSPNCPLWHYILAKGLKHERRGDYGIEKPLKEEEESVLQSCQLSDAPFYRIRLAQMLREQKKLEEAKAIYSDIYKSDPKGQEILLRLARAFTSFREFEKAKRCFKKVAEYPENTMYHHYKGIFYIKTKNFMKAALHFQKAAKRYNYRADLLYAWTLTKAIKDYDFIAHLKIILEKYRSIPKYRQQTLLHIAMNYYYRNNDLKETLAYLLHAIEFDPTSRQLEAFLNTTINWEDLNPYEFTYKKLQEFDDEANLKKEMQDTVEKLRNYCEEYRKNKSKDA